LQSARRRAGFYRAALPLDGSLAINSTPLTALLTCHGLVEAFRAARSGRADALIVFASPFLSSLFREIIDLSAEYQPSLTAVWRQTGTIVVKILKGAAPADPPVEQSVKFELAVNARTTKALGLAMPPSILVRADDLIE
jgi:putative tryptophan/tyrosine transport system substrate-binding protein